MGSAQTPQAPELSRQYVKKTGNGGKARAGAIPCRSWLASEEAITFNIYVDWYAAFAGKPAPTGIVPTQGNPAIFRYFHILSG